MEICPVGGRSRCGLLSVFGQVSDASLPSAGRERGRLSVTPRSTGGFVIFRKYLFLFCSFLGDRPLIQSGHCRPGRDFRTLPAAAGGKPPPETRGPSAQGPAAVNFGKDLIIMKKLFLLTLTLLCLLAFLTGCGGRKAAADKTDDTAETTVAEGQTISGVVNRLGEFLVLLDDNGDYHTFDFGVDVDPSGLEEGDNVTVTYNGTLDSEDETPVATDIEKAA